MDGRKATGPIWLLYGANGYTGELIARDAVARGLFPVLAGRDGDAIRALATTLDLEARVFALDDPAGVGVGLAGMSAVLHAAGPFSRTSRAMADACLRRRVHYLDITGEVAVFEALAARSTEAKQAGVVLLPGVGFDVVPSDCLAAHLARRLPAATHLTLAFRAGSRASHGTATTIVENLHRGGLVRRDGRLTRVPAAWKTRAIDFGRGPRPAMTIPWGDVSTAFHSTGIPNIEVYIASSRALRVAARLCWRLGPIVKSAPVRRLLTAWVDTRNRGPSEAHRSSGRSQLWGEARAGDGTTVVSRLVTPEGYQLTVLTALACLERVLAGSVAPGFQTPALAFGPDFILSIPGCERTDL